MERRLQRSFFTTDALTLARALLGKVLVHRTPLGMVKGIITETEAYMGVEDKGSHTYQGKRTDRTEPMFHIGGTSYVYFIYGMYNCMNITAGDEDVPMAALIRSVEPFDEESRRIMEALRIRKLRKKSGAAEADTGAVEADTGAAEADTGDAEVAGIQTAQAACKASETIPQNVKKHLADGPGKLCIAMQITKEDNDVDLVTSKEFYVTEGIEVEPAQILAGKRIGIDYAEEAADYLWRFTLRQQ